MTFGKAFSVSGLIVFGTTTSLFAKIVYEIQSVGSDGEKKYFHKPWAMTSLMFIGMLTCLPLAYIQESRRQKKRQQQSKSDMQHPLLQQDGTDQHSSKHSEWKQVLLLTIPTFFDLLATILMNIGLLYVTASVYQMMRGAEMLFAALFAVTFLHRHLNRFHLAGITCCVTGVCLVGSSSYLSGQGSSTQDITPEQNLVGMGLIVISQAVQAAQLTFEDFFMADLNIAPMKIVGYEGLFGVIGCLGIMAPVALYLPGREGEGIHEDILDTVTMIKNSRGLMIVLAVDCLALAAYNITGMMVTGHLGAVFRTVLETTRTLFVWIVGLILYYTPLGMGMLGESWSKYSWLQAGGFAVLVCGTLVYQRGEEEGQRRAMEEARAVQAAQEPFAEEEPLLTAAPPGSLQPGTTGGSAFASPINVTPGGTALTTEAYPILIPSSSFKASHTLTVGSYSRSLGRPNSLPRNQGGS